MSDTPPDGSAVVINAGRGRRVIIPVAVLALCGGGIALNAQSVERIEETATAAAESVVAEHAARIDGLEERVSDVAEAVANIEALMRQNAAASSAQLVEIQRALGRLEGAAER